MKSVQVASAIALLAAGAHAVPQTSPGTSATPLYKDPKAKVEDRVADLLSRMTIEEKAAQLVQGDIQNYLNIDTGVFNSTGLQWNMANRASQIWTGYPTVSWATVRDGAIRAQNYLVNQTKLGIPAFIQGEGLHGFLIPNATIFNSAIGMACSFNPDLVEKMAAAIAKEALAVGVNQLFSPVVDLARELRFGRVEETFGEDPYLVGEMGLAYVKGIQKNGVAATVKHFAAFASPEQGINCAPVHGGERELRTTYLPPFKRAIIDGKALSVMSSYNSYDGVPMVANKHTLTDILRNEWGYEYWVTSDASGTDRLCTAFGTCKTNPVDAESIIMQALPAGGDVEMGGGSYSYNQIPKLVKSGKLSEKIVDTAVSRMLRAKFAMGLFEKPLTAVAPAEFAAHINTAETQALARELDAESIVLLDNKKGTLPISKTAKVAVIGPMAHGDMNYGDYVATGSKYRGVTPFTGIKAASKGQVTYSEGCQKWSNDESGFAAAVAAAKAADVAVVVVGTWSRDQTELWQNLNATTGEHIDQASLNLVGASPRLVRAIINTGKPTVVVYSSGKPITEPWISEKAAAVVQQFYPSEQGGNALADILFGDVNPSGKLSVSFPSSVGALPIYYDYLNSARSVWPGPGKEYENGTLQFGSQYVLDTPFPTYAFGHGLSYSKFEYSGLALSKTTASAKDTVTVSVKVKNTGSRDGKEVVQVYVKDVIASVVVPNQQLRAFKKVMVKAGETATVSIDLNVGDLGLWNSEMNYVVEPGEFKIMVGSGSADIRATASLVVA